MSIRGVRGLRGCAAGMVQSGSVCITPQDLAASQAAQVLAAQAAAMASSGAPINLNTYTQPAPAIAAPAGAGPIYIPPSVTQPYGPVLMTTSAAPSSSVFSSVPMWAWIAGGIGALFFVTRK